jgi:hypothetical protein
VLVVVVALYTGSTVAGARQGGGDSGSRQGLPQALGGILVQPAGSSDLVAVDSACRRGSALTVPAGGSCVYRLRSGFLAKRLRLRLTGPGTLTAVLAQPKPKVTDTHTLDAGHQTAELTYRQDGSTLTLTCDGSGKSPCQAAV